MPLSVVAGVDGSRESLAAVDWAAREALVRGLPLHLVHAREWQPYAHAPLADPGAPNRRGERALREAVAGVGLRHPGLEVTAEQVDGRPEAVLAAVAGEAELLALGSHGVGGLAGLVMGSVALAVAARAERPVVLVRAGRAEEDERRPDASGLPSVSTPYRDVVLGVGPAGPCEEVLEFAFDAAARRAAALRIAHGRAPAVPAGFGYGDADPADAGPGRGPGYGEGEEADGLLHVWRRKFPEVEVREQAVVGRPGRHLAEAASDACLVVVGRRARHSSAGTHIGPVAQAVLHHCAAPVAVVPHG
ncbi:universal stress protein [Streptomyces sp. HB2AG]|uniref:universal stress protein n=1 Tax=Streptomyces sp. HB2AG TaxID=2983400 RepID=UPI0022AA073F|nr:universal stress protein [Streptomyces sp. HB2AG]MCZ2523552.1 universal stress protein [Streptomyces sp. HB2AG]